jgi:hypothetical protein
MLYLEGYLYKAYIKRSGFNKLNLLKHAAVFIIYYVFTIYIAGDEELKIHKAIVYLALCSLCTVLIMGTACSSAQAANPNAPLISSLVAEHTSLYPLGNTRIACTAVSPLGLPLNYNWVCTDGTIIGNGPEVTYEAPKTYGDFYIMATVDDGQGNKSSQTVKVTVIVRDPTKCCR